MADIELEFKWRLEALQPGQRLPLAWGAQAGWLERLGSGVGAFAETAVPPLELIPLLRLLSEPFGGPVQVLLWRERLLVCAVFAQLDMPMLGEFIRRYAGKNLAQIAADHDVHAVNRQAIEQG